MRSITLRSPAKLNLILKVINKRPDGYHNLKILFERIDLCDDIRLTPNKTGRIRISCDHPRVPQGPRNLVYAVAKTLKEEHKISGGVHIKITKRIPVAAGLGGGSSNAATVLLGLNRIWRLSLSKEKLLQYGRSIGSDVPFFLYNCSWGIGVNRGDCINKVSLSAKLWHVLVVPCVQLYSREVFRSLNSRVTLSPRSFERCKAPTLKTRKRKEGSMNVLTKKNDNVNILIHYLKKSNRCKVENLLSNDLEERILQICPRLSNVKTRLQSCDLKGVIFSGSGPSVFGLVESKQKAESLKTVLRKHYKQVFVVRTL